MRRRLLALTVTAVILIAGYLLWLRDSALVQVDTVTVTGLTSSDGGRVRAALEAAARDTTTLHVDREKLERAAAPFSAVRSIEVRPDFPDAMRIHVSEYRPVALLVSGSRRVPVAGDGAVLTGLPVKGDLPLVRTVGALPTGRLAAGAQLSAARVAGGVPAALGSRVQEIVRQRGKGVVVPLEDGPRIIFGDGASVRAKWAAAVRVLADPDAAGAAYVDVRIPERPAAGGLPVETVAPLAPAGAPPPVAGSGAGAGLTQPPPAPQPAPGLAVPPAATTPGSSTPPTPQPAPADPPVSTGGGTVPNAEP